MPKPQAALPPVHRIPFVFLNLGCGLLPSLAFFAWVERNASLPWIGLELGWPWVAGQSWPIYVQCAWDVGLFLAFGLIHSGLAQTRAQSALRHMFPLAAIRTVYVAVTGLSLLAVMGLWQNTGIVLWWAPLPFALSSALSMAIFWGCLALSLRVMRHFDALEFIGLKQLYSSHSELERPEGMPQLQTTGIYSRVRHPIYAFTSLAFVLAPGMTLDRALLCVTMGLYLSVAIPVEERKLIALFGSDYEKYRAKVPALVPRVF